MHVAGLAGLHSPGLGAEQRKAGLEVGERVCGASLGEPQPSTGRRDQHGSHAGGPALLWEQVEQRLRLVELAGLDGDIGQDGRREREPRREVPLLQDAQRDPRCRVGLGERAEPQLEQAERAVGGHEAARRPGAVNLGQHRVQRRLDRVEALGRDQDPQQRRARVPVLDRRAGARQRLLERHRDLVRRADRRGTSPSPGRPRAPRWGPRADGRRGARATGVDPRRATGVVKTADDELALESGRERLVGLAELRERRVR